MDSVDSVDSGQLQCSLLSWITSGQCWSVDSKVLKPDSWVTGGQFIIFKIAVCTCRGQSSLFNTHYQFIMDYNLENVVFL